MPMLEPGTGRTATPAPHTPPELQDGWEFKVLASSGLAFRDPRALRRAVEEEARAGWTLLEKLDDGRLRFKRPVGERARDSARGFDAYRTRYGDSRAALQIVFWLLILGGAILLYYLMARR
jgi:hypothetical protein